VEVPKRNGPRRQAASGADRLKPHYRLDYLRGVNQPGSAGAGARCLIVDDDGTVRQALTRVIEGHGLATIEAASGVEALAVLHREGEIPLCISDVHMAEMDGVTFLREALRLYPDMAIIMLTGVADVGTAVECLKLGALDYIAKPVVMDEVRARVDKALEKRQLVLQNRFYQKNLESRVRELDRRNKESLINGVQTLVHALEAKDPYTSGHSSRVSRYAVKTAIQLGYIGELLQHIKLGAELHDIGKIGTREAVLNKPGPLTPDEFEHIKEHTLLGEKILAPFLSESAMALRIVRSHHERMDGAGFPDGLPGDAIPREARIVAVVDAFDAMTTNRAYRPSRTPSDAFDELRRCAGSHFDTEVVDAFASAFRDLTALPIGR
jgi:putative two-component system response regulator